MASTASVRITRPAHPYRPVITNWKATYPPSRGQHHGQDFPLTPSLSGGEVKSRSDSAVSRRSGTPSGRSTPPFWRRKGRSVVRISPRSIPVAGPELGDRDAIAAHAVPGGIDLVYEVMGTEMRSYRLLKSAGTVPVHGMHA